MFTISNSLEKELISECVFAVSYTVVEKIGDVIIGLYKGRAGWESPDYFVYVSIFVGVNIS